MKRNRPLLYEVLGPDRSIGAQGAQEARSKRPRTRSRRPLARWTWTWQHVAGLVGVVLVLGWGSYYLGGLRGGQDSQGVSLSSESRGPGQPGTAAAIPDEYYAVQACTVSWKRPEDDGMWEAQANDVLAFLDQRGYPEVQGVLDREKRRFVVYVGRSQEREGELDEIVKRLKNETFEGRQDFRQAYVIHLQGGAGR